VVSLKTGKSKQATQKKQPKPDDTQIPRPDLRFAIERKRRSNTKNGAGARTKHPQQRPQDLPGDMLGMSHHVIKNMHYELIRFIICGPANSVKKHQQFAVK
jgi:hypothetical protein